MFKLSDKDFVTLDIRTKTGTVNEFIFSFLFEKDVGTLIIDYGSEKMLGLEIFR